MFKVKPWADALLYSVLQRFFFIHVKHHVPNENVNRASQLSEEPPELNQ